MSSPKHLRFSVTLSAFQYVCFLGNWRWATRFEEALCLEIRTRFLFDFRAEGIACLAG
jgi:hypothetical protein